MSKRTYILAIYPAAAFVLTSVRDIRIKSCMVNAIRDGRVQLMSEVSFVANS